MYGTHEKKVQEVIDKGKVWSGLSLDLYIRCGYSRCIKDS